MVVLLAVRHHVHAQASHPVLVARRRRRRRTQRGQGGSAAGVTSTGSVVRMVMVAPAAPSAGASRRHRNSSVEELGRKGPQGLGSAEIAANLALVQTTKALGVGEMTSAGALLLLRERLEKGWTGGQVAVDVVCAVGAGATGGVVMRATAADAGNARGVMIGPTATATTVRPRGCATA